MKTNEKRIRIFEIIAGILLILLALNMYYTFLRAIAKSLSYITFGYLVNNIPAFLAGVFIILLGVMIIFRKYDKLWIKIVYGITGAAAVMSTNGGYVIRGLFDKRDHSLTSFASFSMYLSPRAKFFFITATAIMTVAIVVALLTMCGVIKWRSRSRLLIYAYIMTGLEMLICLGANDISFVAVDAVMLPCFMQEAESETKKRSIAGEAAFLLLPVLPRILNFLGGFFSKVFGFIKVIATGVNPPDYGDSNTVSFGVIKWVSVILLALIPLMVFGRKFTSETESAAASAGSGESREADGI